MAGLIVADVQPKRTAQAQLCVNARDLAVGHLP